MKLALTLLLVLAACGSPIITVPTDAGQDTGKPAADPLDRGRDPPPHDEAKADEGQRAEVFAPR